MAALYPEWIDGVAFHEPNRRVDAAYEEPFYRFRKSTWTLNGVVEPDPGDWRPVVHHAGGATSEVRP